MKIFLLLFAVFAATSANTTIHCTFHHWNLPPLGAVYGCHLQSFQIGGSLIVTRVTGSHLIGMDNQNVDFFVTNSHRLLLNVAQVFPRLRGFQQTFSELNSLNANDFEELVNLEQLFLDDNPIGHIPGGFLSNNRQMTSFTCNWCHISTVGERFLDTLSNFQSAQFHANLCINQVASHPSFIPHLIINMRNNCAINDEPSTTTTTVTTSTLPPPVEGNCNLHETVCRLEKKVEILLGENAEMNSRLDSMSEAMNEMKLLLIQLSSRPCSIQKSEIET